MRLVNDLSPQIDSLIKVGNTTFDHDFFLLVIFLHNFGLYIALQINDATEDFNES